jgi:3-mercaptopyruvate sulfurtransferase SseA
MRDLAIRNTHASVVTINGGIDAWDANGDVVDLDESAIATEVTRLQAVYDAKAYQRTRAAAYPELKEQLDLLYHDMVADKGDKTGEWFKAVKAVKDATAKPE